MASIPLDRTIQSYNRIAPDYLDRWRVRSVTKEHSQRFVSLLVEQGVTDHPIIDVGCGPGFDAAVLRESGLQVVGLDLSLGMMQAGRSEFPGDFVLADMRCLPLGPSAGGLWVSASLLHLPREDVPAAFHGFARTLIPGGVLYLAVKQGHGEEWTQESYGRPEPRHFTYWLAGELDSHLDEAGFNIVESATNPSESNPNAFWLVRFAVL